MSVASAEQFLDRGLRVISCMMIRDVSREVAILFAMPEPGRLTEPLLHQCRRCGLQWALHWDRDGSAGRCRAPIPARRNLQGSGEFSDARVVPVPSESRVRSGDSRHVHTGHGWSWLVRFGYVAFCWRRTAKLAWVAGRETARLAQRYELAFQAGQIHLVVPQSVATATTDLAPAVQNTLAKILNREGYVAMTDQDDGYSIECTVSQSERAVSGLETTGFDAGKLCGGRRNNGRPRTMRFARKETEVVVHLNNEPTSVGEVMVAATAPHVDILASCFYWSRDGAVMRLVTEDPQKTAEALAAAGFSCATASVLLIGLQQQPGVAARIGIQLAAAGIAVRHSYVSWTEHNEAFAVLKTTDDDRALRLLQGEVLMEELAREKTRRVPEARPMRLPVSSRWAA